MASPDTEKSIGQAESGMASIQNLKLLENIEVKLTVEVGGTKITIRDLLKLNEGSIVELERLAGEHLDILVNGTLLAKGEIVLVGERLGIRFTEIISPEQRLRSI
jgi:flagellar motor switch protein FliN/FliY